MEYYKCIEIDETFFIFYNDKNKVIFASREITLMNVYNLFSEWKCVDEIEMSSDFTAQIF